ncbi:hypothetical protein ZEAMMB73_Zm00001d003158 [Zea mays]|uniref:Uncharacterized protein n=1 Tax=Zea mays TaxID=4577 RepID=A0A1D6E759_MAIZE|nr:hypothetical protein ZEAMMB73_Zm00001d003158 [Zea mays]ONM16278.1 hypothetical protein ZEAMMB73_Zm00001d003158 [Zea mays]
MFRLLQNGRFRIQTAYGTIKTCLHDVMMSSSKWSMLAQIGKEN